MALDAPLRSYAKQLVTASEDRMNELQGIGGFILKYSSVWLNTSDSFSSYFTNLYL